MTELRADPPGDGPPRDQLAEIKARYWRAAEADTIDTEAYGADVRWLVGEVERLQGKLAMAEKELEIRHKIENWHDNR